MNGDVRRKLEAGARVREFSRANPSDDPSYISTLARLEERLDRADALATRERAGRIAERGAKLRRDELRFALQRRLLRHIARVGEAAAKIRPELVGKFELRFPNHTHKAFLVAANAIYAEAQANRELMVSLGLSARMLDETGRVLAQFEEAVEAGAAGRASHIGARTELDEVADDVVGLVLLLDDFHRDRFQDDGELLAAWVSTREVRTPSRRKSVRPPPTGDEGTPPASGVAPAA